MNKFILFLLALVSGFVARAGEADRVTVAVISINDFHSCFVRNDFKQMPGAAALWQTIDSLQSRLSAQRRGFRRRQLRR
ncbi:MAG: hypothetical protein ACOCM7_04850 [Bacteroidales bacterium]